MKTLQITSRHNTLAEAVKATNFDLSYNEALGQRHILDADSPCKRAKEIGIGATERAYVVNDDGKTKIMTVYTVHGMRFIREFSPFCGCLDSCDMRGFTINDIEGLIGETGATFAKNGPGRKLAAIACKDVPEFVLM